MLLTTAGLSITTAGLLPIKLRSVVQLRGVGGVGGVGVTGGVGLTASGGHSFAPLTTLAPNSIAFFRNGYELLSAPKSVNIWSKFVALLATRLAKGIL